MLQHAEAINEIELARPERQVVYVALHDVQAVREFLAMIFTAGLHGDRIVQRHHLRARLQRNLGESSRAAAHNEDPLARQLFPLPATQRPDPSTKKQKTTVTVMLRAPEHVPLISEVAG